jgi:hypothetical protein
MLPNKSDNIYPYTKKNVKAILKYYFDIPNGNIEWILELRELEINQLEWIAKKVSENIDFFNDNINPNYGGRTISNFMKYGIDALYYGLEQFKKENERKRITKEFFELTLR